MEEKTYVDDIDRSLYDFRNEDKDAYRIQEGLTREIVEKISREKHDPEWMLEFRLKSLDIYNKLQVPNWGPSIDGLNMDNIVTYVRPNTNMQGKWEDVPEDIKDTFDRLGIPQAEQSSLAGVGAQYDSEVVYHNVRKEVEEQGVIYTDMESALNALISTPSRKKVPSVCLSRHPIMFIRVVFPEPDGPIIATYSPSSMEKFTSFNTGTFILPC